MIGRRGRGRHSTGSKRAWEAGRHGAAANPPLSRQSGVTAVATALPRRSASLVGAVQEPAYRTAGEMLKALRYPPAPLRRPSEAIEIEVDYGRRVEGQNLADEQSADDRNAEWAAQFGTLAESDC
jgi:hypothetical protein